MLIPTVWLACCLLPGAFPLPDQDFSQQLYSIKNLVEGGNYAEAIAGYLKLLQEVPKPLQGPVTFEIAALHAALGNSDRALTAMDQAIKSGFDDCAALQRDELKSIRGDSRFNRLVSGIRISESDLKELFWLKAEVLNVRHETNMMITENMNRQDGGITVVPQSMIPIRETASPAVLFNRELLKMTQLGQRHYVFEADKLRMKHLTSMTIISGGASAQRMALSASIASGNAEQRKRAIDARKFALPPGAGTTPQPCGGN